MGVVRRDRAHCWRRDSIRKILQVFGYKSVFSIVLGPQFPVKVVYLRLDLNLIGAVLTHACGNIKVFNFILNIKVESLLYTASPGL